LSTAEGAVDSQGKTGFWIIRKNIVFLGWLFVRIY